MSIKLFDTTLRDGTQREGVSLTAEDKARIARELDSLGLHYIEAGFPASNPKDLEFFEGFDASELKNARLVAFTRARRPGGRAEDDPAVTLLPDLSAPVACIVAKSWKMHVEKVLRTTVEENLASVRDTVAYLANAGKEVIFDAEHYFDGFRDDPEHALSVLRAAAEAGATTLVLCDTNGGTLPTELKAVVARTVREFPEVEVGIHTHNDAGCGVANALAAVEAGATHVQGTVNGVGERTGNCDLVTTIANLQLKMGLEVMAPERLKKLTETSNYVSELMNLTPDSHRPYVGRSAFAHKGGLHVDGISKDPATYEHVAPELVGNVRRTPVGELSGKNSIRAKAEELGLEAGDVTAVLSAIKQREHEGYHYEAADASLALLIGRTTGEARPLFDLESFRIISEKRAEGGACGETTVEATIKLVVKGQRVISTAEGNGPVNALDRALRQAIEPHYPELKGIHLSNYKVRILDEHRATAATTRVLIDSTDGKRVWGAVGVGENIIEASWQALVDGLEYGVNGPEKG
jgi:2-isopropylmalate synthase